MFEHFPKNLFYYYYYYSILLIMPFLRKIQGIIILIQ